MDFSETIAASDLKVSRSRHLNEYMNRVAMVREKSLENEIFSRSGKSQGISILVREI